MQPITPHKSFAELTVQRIRAAIIHGDLPLGSKVSEQSLADRLGISRSPVREALALLQIEGLIRVVPKSGSFVFTPDDKDVVDLCDHRTVLEAACLGFAIDRNPRALADGLRRGIKQMERALRAGDSQAYSDADMEFHRVIIDTADNQSIAKHYDTTIGPLMAVRTHIFTVMNETVDRSMAEHAALLGACEDRDVARAEAIVTQHIRHLAQAYATASTYSQFMPSRRAR